MSKTITIAQICLANAKRDDASEEYRLVKRLPRFKKLLQDYKDTTDVFSIKEVRACTAEDGKSVKSAESIVNELLANDPDLGLAILTPVKLHRTAGVPAPFHPFYLCQIYNAKKVMLLKVDCNHYYQDVYPDVEKCPTMGGCKIQCAYAPIDNNGYPILDKKFSVESYHLPLANSDKTMILEYLNKNQINDADVRCGDFNLFQDDPDHDHHLKLLTTYYNDHCSQLMQNQKGEPMYGTFWPFPHDKPPVQLDPPHINSKNTSKLDYFFTHKLSSLSPIKCLLLENENSSKPHWDHLPFFCTLEFKAPQLLLTLTDSGSPVKTVKSCVFGKGHGSAHLWQRLDTNQIYGYSSNPADKYSRYQCAKCDVKFIHRYDIIRDIFEAMKAYGISDKCT